MYLINQKIVDDHYFESNELQKEVLWIPNLSFSFEYVNLSQKWDTKLLSISSKKLLHLAGPL